MKVNFDLESYRAMFSGGTRSYLFFVNFMFPIINNPAPTGSFLSDVGTSFESTVSKVGLKGASYMAAAKNTLSIFGVGKDNLMYPYLVKSTSLPETSFEEVAVKYGALTYKLAGEKTYSDWTVSLNVDDKGEILQKFHQWHDGIYDRANGNIGMPYEYMQPQEIHLLDYTGNTTKVYKMFYCWPKSIGETTLDYSSNEIATFNVTFSYSYFTIENGQDSLMNNLAKKVFNQVAGRI